MKLQTLDNLLLNLVVMFEPRRIKGVTLLRAADAAKQLVIHVRCGEILPSLAAEGAMHGYNLHESVLLPTPIAVQCLRNQSST